MTTEETVTKDFEAHLQNKIKDMYPNTLESVHFVPPIYFNKIQYKTQSVADKVAYIPEPSDPTAMIKDTAMQHFLQCVRHMAERRKEQMFLLTKFQYDDYLRYPDDDFQQHRLPTPSRDVNHNECIDFLIIHLNIGIIVGVVKAIIDQDVEMIATEVTEGIQRLEKACQVLNHLMSDQEHIPKVQQVLVLFNITESALPTTLINHTEVFKVLL